jgi:hypothetical protein
MAMQRLRVRTMLLIGTVALVVPVLWQISPVGATTGSYTDPRPCSAAVNSGVCISQVSAEYGSSTITLSMTVGAGTDPTTDPGWQNSTTFNGWNIGVNGAPTSTYIAVGEGASVPGTYSGEVGQADAITPACDASDGVTASYEASANTYQESFPASCIGSPRQLPSTPCGSWEM